MDSLSQEWCTTNLINTGLEADAARRYTSLAVLTASLIVPMQFVTIDEFLEFFCERSHAVVFFLIDDLTRYQIHIGMRHRECAIPSGPRKFSRKQLIRIHPVRRTSL